MTYSRGVARLFQGDFVGALYILTPLLESSLRHVLKSYGHDVTIFDDSTLTQQDRTISSLGEARKLIEHMLGNGSANARAEYWRRLRKDWEAAGLIVVKGDTIRRVA